MFRLSVVRKLGLVAVRDPAGRGGAMRKRTVVLLLTVVFLLGGSPLFHAQMTTADPDPPGETTFNTSPVSANGVCIVDQSSLSENAPMAAFEQTDLAQSFTPAQDSSCGARAKLRANFGNGQPGDVTIELWDALPNAGGVLLASGTDPGVLAGQFADVTWPTVLITPGMQYFLVFTSTNLSLAVAGDTNNPYPGGHVYANAGYSPFPDFDYTFETLYEFQSGDDMPASSPLGLLVLLAILMTVSWAILRPRWGARHPT